MRLEYYLINWGYWVTLRVFDDKLTLRDTNSGNIIEEKPYSPKNMEKMLRRLQRDYYERIGIQKLCDICGEKVGKQHEPSRGVYSGDLKADIEAHNKQFHS